MSNDDWHKTYKAVFDDDNPTMPSGGWVQWKGTDVCVDLHCECGWNGHVDRDFFYAMECPNCHAKYAVGQNIKLIPLKTAQQLKYIEMHDVVIPDDEQELPI